MKTQSISFSWMRENMNFQGGSIMQVQPYNYNTHPFRTPITTVGGGRLWQISTHPICNNWWVSDTFWSTHNNNMQLKLDERHWEHIYFTSDRSRKSSLILPLFPKAMMEELHLDSVDGYLTNVIWFLSYKGRLS